MTVDGEGAKTHARARTRRGAAYAVSALLMLVATCGAGRAFIACAVRIPPAYAAPLTAASAPDAVTGDMVRVRSGEFSMGNASGEDDEAPVRTVELSAFEIDRTEVTVRSYGACVAAGACEVAGEDPYCNWSKRTTRGDHPINCVSWHDAKAFCAWAGKRLPTEGEWEFAARGPGARRFPWGNEAPNGRVCWDGKGSDVAPGQRRGTCVVASHPTGKSAFGVEDMAGNVLEWTSDFYSASYAADPSTTHRVNRGGSWITYEGADLRASLRFRMTPARRDFTVGFRCVR